MRARRRNRYGVCRNLRFKRIEPAGIRRAHIGQQAQPFAQVLVIAVEMRDMVGRIGKHSRSRNLRRAAAPSGENPVHLRREPDGGDMFGQVALAFDFLAIEADHPPRRAARFAFKPRAETQGKAGRAFQLRRDGPAGIRTHRGTRQLVQFCPAQALAGGQKADGLKDVGLPAPLGPAMTICRAPPVSSRSAS